MLRKIALNDLNSLSLQEVDDLPLHSGMVRVQVKACSVCGSDLALISGKRDITKELYFGHEFSGVVLNAADDSCGFTYGMRVASELSDTSGKCWNCRNGMPEYCRSMNDALLPGGFTENTLVRSTPDYSFLSPLPPTLDYITASLLEPTNCAFQIAKSAALKPGDNVVVFGLGAMGFITAIILKSLGAGAVVGVGIGSARLIKARETGIFDAVIKNDDEGQNAIQEICGKNGVDVVIEATGSSQVLVDAMQIVHPGGRVVVGSVYHSAIPSFDPLPVFRKELTIIGAKGPSLHRKTDGSSETVCLMNRIQEELKKIIRVYDYKDALQAFEDARYGEAIKAVIRF